MSRSIYADQVSNLETQLAAALTEHNKTRDALKQSQEQTAAWRESSEGMKKQRDEARASVASLKELLHNAELSANRCQGQLDRINELERRAAVPMETRSVTVPFQENRPYYGNTGYVGTVARAGDKHWTSL